MSEEKKIFGLEDISNFDYTPKPKADTTGLEGIAAPVFADDDYVAVPKKVNNSLEGLAAPVFADDDYSASKKTNTLDDVAKPTLSDDTLSSTPTAPEIKELTDAQIKLLQEKRIAKGMAPYTEAQIQQLKDAYRAKQQNGTPAPAAPEMAPPPPPPAPLLEEPTYEAPAKKASLDDIAAPKLEAAEPEPVQNVSRFSEEEIEEAKRNAKKRAIESSLNTTTTKNPEEARMYMDALRRERESAAAKKGFKSVIFLMIMGFVAAIGFYMFSLQFDVSSEALSGFYATMAKSSLYVSVVQIVCSILLLFRINAVKSLTSFMFGLSGLLMLFPGLPMLMLAESKMPTAIYWGIALFVSIIVCFKLSTDENVEMFYKRREFDE